MKPLWQMMEDQAVNEILDGFRETERHLTYGPYGYAGSDGRSRMNRRTHDAILIAAYISGWGAIEFTQGGLNAGSVAASAATHNGLGVADTSVRGKSSDEQRKLVSAGMDCGVIGFIRGTTADNISDGMVPHIHWVTVGGNDKHPSAKEQIYNSRYGYANGGAGLAGAPGARWWGPARKPLVTWEQSKYNPKNGWRP